MVRKSHSLLIALFFFFPVFLFGQQPDVVSGEVKNLLNIEEINVEFDFSEWTFYEEKMSEEEYIKKRKEDIAEDDGEEEAEKWYNDWIETRDHEIKNKFINGINDGIRDKIDFGLEKDTKYTLIVRVEWVYPGYFAVVMNQPAKATTSLLFVESTNNDNVILELYEEEVRGAEALYMGTAANTNNRISNVFTTTGENVGNYLRKKLKRAERKAK